MGTYYKHCPECEGTGTFNFQKCNYCGGIGAMNPVQQKAWTDEEEIREQALKAHYEENEALAHENEAFAEELRDACCFSVIGK